MNILYDIETESKVLGQILVEPDAFLKVSELLNVGDFYDNKNARIFEAIQNVFKSNKGIDYITVTTEAKKLSPEISVYEISKLSEGVAAASHLEYHARIIKDFAVRRKMLLEIEKLKNFGEATENDLDQFIDRASVFVDNVLSEVNNRSEIREFRENVSEAIEHIKQSQKGSKSNSGAEPSLHAIRTFVPTWENGDLIVLAARPGMGKTAFAVHELFHIAMTAGPVLFFSLEMSRRQVAGRVLQAQSSLSRYDFDNMSAEKWEVLDNATSKIIDANFFIDDTSGVTLAHIKAKAKIFKKQHDIRGLVVDYLQLMRADKTLSREQQVADISRNMKLIAKEVDLPVFLVAQLNRGPESRPTEAFRPKMSDLRESGAIEQDADIVLFPHRPSYYMPDDPEFEGKTELIFAKNRQGKTGIATVAVNKTITKFYDIVSENEEMPY